jgi:hypothetical protein
MNPHVLQTGGNGLTDLRRLRGVHLLQEALEQELCDGPVPELTVRFGDVELDPGARVDRERALIARQRVLVLLRVEEAVALFDPARCFLFRAGARSFRSAERTRAEREYRGRDGEG